MLINFIMFLSLFDNYDGEFKAEFENYSMFSEVEKEYFNMICNLSFGTVKGTFESSIPRKFASLREIQPF